MQKKGKIKIPRHHAKRTLLNQNIHKEFEHSAILQDNSYLSVLFKKIPTYPKFTLFYGTSLFIIIKGWG